MDVCSLTDICHNAVDSYVHAYACQETVVKIPGTDLLQGKDLGHVLGWYPYEKMKKGEKNEAMKGGKGEENKKTRKR